MYIFRVVDVLVSAAPTAGAASVCQVYFFLRADFGNHQSAQIERVGWHICQLPTQDARGTFSVLPFLFWAITLYSCYHLTLKRSLGNQRFGGSFVLPSQLKRESSSSSSWSHTLSIKESTETLLNLATPARQPYSTKHLQHRLEGYPSP